MWMLPNFIGVIWQWIILMKYIGMSQINLYVSKKLIRWERSWYGEVNDISRH